MHRGGTMEQVQETTIFLNELIKATSRTTPLVKIAQQYDVSQRLGQGAFGRVLRATHKESGKTVALKVMRKGQVKKNAFLQELCISLLLSSHPSIISTFRLSFHTTQHYVIAQEVAPAGDLHSIMQPGVGIEEEKVKRVAWQLASALQYMHDRSLVHRDLKPDNVLLMDRECHSVRLTDFGLTQLEGSSITCVACITPYMAPELCLLKLSDTLLMDPSLDVWAFGVLLFTLLTGYFPWSQALTVDREYRAFRKWQIFGNDDFIPPFWKSFTPGAWEMFNTLMAINPTRRIPVEEVLGYIDGRWMMTSPAMEGMEESSPVTSESREVVPMPSNVGSLSLEESTWLCAGAEIEVT